MGKTALGCLAILVVAVVVAGIYVAGQFNGLVTAEESTREHWAQVETAYQRRSDLVPNLMETVKGAAEFEQETLNQLVEARS